MFQIAKYISVGRHGKGGVINTGSKQLVITDKNKWEICVIILSKFIEKNNFKDIESHLISSYPNIPLSEFYDSFNYLKNNGVIKEEFLYNPTERYSRSKIYYSYFDKDPNEVQNNLKNSSVTIIGCGGIGNHVSAILATAGVGTITLVDADKIEKSNLTRQVLFSEQDVGKYKINILERELIKRNHNTIVKTINLNINSIDDFNKIEKSDVFIISADSPFELIEWTNQYCVLNQQAYINVGYINDISLIGPFYIPNKTACFNCCRYIPDFIQHDPLQNEIEIINKNFKPATAAPVNNIAAAIAANDILKYLGNFGEILSVNKRIGIYSNSLKIETQDFSINTECQVCQKTYN